MAFYTVTITNAPAYLNVNTDKIRQNLENLLNQIGNNPTIKSDTHRITLLSQLLTKFVSDHSKIL